MTVIVKNLKIGWLGKEYQVALSFELANKIEQDINLQRFAEQASMNDVRWTDAAIIFTHIFNHAGVNVTPQEVFSEMFGGDIDAAEARDTIVEIVSMFFPDRSKKKPRKTPNK